VIPLLVVAGVAVVAIVAVLVQQDRHATQVSHLLAHMAAEQHTQARERWDLNTRIQAPTVAAHLPQPAQDPAQVLRTLGLMQDVAGPPDNDDLDVDESYLVGTGPEAPR
jgi:hypothetical protein